MDKLAKQEAAEMLYAPPKLQPLENETSTRLLPPHSREKYLAEYKKFINWTKHKNAPINEKVLLTYFSEFSKSLAPSSLWSRYFVLKCTLQIYRNINISKFKRLRAFLKKKKEGYQPSKPKILTEKEIECFLKTAPDEEYLITKVALIFGFLGALRIEELFNICTDQVEEHGSIFLVKIPTRRKHPKSFTIHSEYYDIVKKYKNLRPADCKTNRFFLIYKHQKCSVQPIGKRRLALMPRHIAIFLNLENPIEYTGHTFHSSSTTALANAGASKNEIKRQGCWERTNIATGTAEHGETEAQETGEIFGTSPEWRASAMESSTYILPEEPEETREQIITDEIMQAPSSPKLRASAKDASTNMLTYSKGRYLSTYKKFMDWKKERNAPISENVFLAYFSELSKSLAPPSLWFQYSALKSTIHLHHDIDISAFKKLTALLKREAEGYKPKLAKILTQEQIDRFLKTAPDRYYLAIKVAVIFGFFGALRLDELVNIYLDQVEEHGNIFLVRIPNKKTKRSRFFTIHSEYYHIVKKYTKLRPAYTTVNRFFLNYKNQKCTEQPIGRNKFAAMAKCIATFLKLEDPQLYSGNIFRRSSAIALGKTGAGVQTIKRHRSSEGANTGTDNSHERAGKRQADTIIVAPPEWRASTEGTSTNFLSVKHEEIGEPEADGLTRTPSEWRASAEETSTYVLPDEHEVIENPEAYKVICEQSPPALRALAEEETCRNDAAQGGHEEAAEREADEVLCAPTSPNSRASTTRETSSKLMRHNSNERYMTEYNRFTEWRERKNAPICENAFLAYFSELSKSLVPTSLWSRYSMLKSTILQHHNVNIGEFTKILDLLRRQSVGYQRPKKKVLTQEEVERFLKNASDQQYLVVKVALAFGFFGALRIDELVNICIDHVEEYGNIFFVKVPDKKSKHAKAFTVHSDYHDMIKSYIKLRPANCTVKRFFLNYKNQKCTAQPIARNKFAEMARCIASFLNLSDPKQYTGHTYRCSSVTALKNTGADIQPISWTDDSNGTNAGSSDYSTDESVGGNDVKPANVPTTQCTYSTENGADRLADLDATVPMFEFVGTDVTAADDQNVVKFEPEDVYENKNQNFCDLNFSSRIDDNRNDRIADPCLDLIKVESFSEASDQSIDLFFRSIAERVKKFDPVSRAMVKNEISDVISRFEELARTTRVSSVMQIESTDPFG